MNEGLAALERRFKPYQQEASRVRKARNPLITVNAPPLSATSPVQWGELDDGTERLGRVQLLANGRAKLTLVVPPGSNVRKLEELYQKYFELCVDHWDKQELLAIAN